MQIPVIILISGFLPGSSGSYYLLQNINIILASPISSSIIDFEGLGSHSIATLKLKLKKTRKARACSQCSKTINKGELYGSKSQTVIYDKEGQSFNSGRSWEPLRISKKIIFCEVCSYV